MNKQDAIKCLKSIQQWVPDFDDREDGLSYWDAIDMAIDALDPPNEPLTLEQLREMDGEPVWDEKGKCYLVDTTYQFCSDSDIEIAIVDKRSIERYPYRITLYRRPPEGDDAK